MKFCTIHWDRMIDEVKGQGLWKYVANDGEQAKQKIEEGNPDPLIGSTMAVYFQFLQVYGLAALEGEVCPFCKMKETGAPDAVIESWIVGSVEDQRARHGALSS